MRRFLFKAMPWIVASLSVGVILFINIKFHDNYFNIRGYRSVLESVVGFLSIVIGFYSAFYGMIISMTKTKFMKELQNSKYNEDLPKLLIWSLSISFIELILTIIMQVLVNYKSNLSFYLYLIWSFFAGAFITYAYQTALLSIAMVFGSEPQQRATKEMDI